MASFSHFNKCVINNTNDTINEKILLLRPIFEQSGVLGYHLANQSIYEIKNILGTELDYFHRLIVICSSVKSKTQYNQLERFGIVDKKNSSILALAESTVIKYGDLIIKSVHETNQTAQKIYEKSKACNEILGDKHCLEVQDMNGIGLQHLLISSFKTDFKTMEEYYIKSSKNINTLLYEHCRDKYFDFLFKNVLANEEDLNFSNYGVLGNIHECHFYKTDHDGFNYNKNINNYAEAFSCFLLNGFSQEEILNKTANLLTNYKGKESLAVDIFQSNIKKLISLISNLTFNPSKLFCPHAFSDLDGSEHIKEFYNCISYQFNESDRVDSVFSCNDLLLSM
ncbi:hypothetical protein [Rickettsiales endosymbiont of Trichoplax sp. H2]|uniref:hypothetical protein n=1 Tax=Rickettsiales endosymbiont of Trichoplax sp. H2 TaxID=2021221 RepID=UPI0012B26069|nr:hypothetical protein [Rickettsiales endosymbiont of Trichoplax sp. H2]MSO13695.1 hypothetical protein [Rickettsiales endosymbiont of Trichoplax sp. H2]